MDTENQIKYEVLLDMISCFQWMPDQCCLRLAVDHSLEHPVLRALNKLAGEIAHATTGRHLGNAQAIQEVLSRRPDLLYAGSSDEVISEVDQIVEMVGVGPDLIGFGNLYTMAFALTMRPKGPLRWNDFCHHVDRPSWQVAIQTNNAGPSSTLGTPPAAPSAAVTGYALEEDTEALPEEDFQPDTSGEYVATKVCVKDADESRQPKRGGLSGAFDNAEFKEKADKLLNRHREEDIAALHSVISEPASLPTGCSQHHELIREKYSTVRHSKDMKK